MMLTSMVDLVVPTEAPQIEKHPIEKIIQIPLTSLMSIQMIILRGSSSPLSPKVRKNIKR